MVTHSVAFDVRQPGAYAVQLRLTPALLEALLAAQDDGQPVSIRFGQGTQGGVSAAGCPATPGRAAAVAPPPLPHKIAACSTAYRRAGYSALQP